MAEITVLHVRLGDTPVGTITHLPGDQTLFAFEDSYIADEARPTLSLSFKDAYGGLIQDHRPVQTRLPPFFANLLPEGALRTYLARQAGVKEMREFPLIGALGGDLPGAVVVEPAEGETWPAGGGETRDDDPDAPLRFSLAGVQLKFSAVNEAQGGLTIPARGVGGDWIVKLPSATYANVPQNEFAMMTLARQLGIDVPEIQLIPVREIAGLPRGVEEVEGEAFAIRRFDRQADGGRVHIEDFAQVFAVFPDRKYKNASYRNIAEVLWAEIGAEAIAKFVRRLVFNILIGNADMHLKNWSLIYPDGRTPALAPAYDFVSTIAYIADDKMGLSLAGKGTHAFEAMTLDAFARFANKAGLPEHLVVSTAQETIERFDALWVQEKANLPLGKAVVRAIETHRGKVFQR
jgi:serine/threonine-protein kinase HipA